MNSASSLRGFPAARDRRQEGGGGEGRQRIGPTSKDSSLDRCEVGKMEGEKESVKEGVGRILGFLEKKLSLKGIKILLEVEMSAFIKFLVY